jgi:sugar phosphate isomerase/epimerase
MNRRAFLIGGAFSAAAFGSATATAATRLKTSIFSRHLQFLSGPELPKAARELGFDGIGLTVRNGGHVEPSRVAQDLPPLVKLIRQEGLDIPMIATNIADASSPFAENILRTAGELGIRLYRWGSFRYEADAPILPQLDALKPRVEKLAALNKKYNLTAAYHTFAGNTVGASIWDLYYVLKDFDPKLVGYNFDIGHMTTEGAAGSWATNLRMTGLYLHNVSIKDYSWSQGQNGQWTRRASPLGQGIVRLPQFFQILAQMNYSGSAELQTEYPLGGADTGQRTLTLPREEVYAAFRRDLQQIRDAATAAGWN